MNRNLRERWPLHSVDIGQILIWCTRGFEVGNYKLSHADALLLFTKRFKTIADLWNSSTNQFKLTRLIAKELELSPQATIGLENMIANLKAFHQYYLEMPNFAFFLKSWIESFLNKHDENPAFLLQTTDA